MGFTKTSFLDAIIEIKTPLPAKYGGGEIVLPLRLAKNREFMDLQEKFLAKPEAERDIEASFLVLRNYIFSLLAEVPTGVDDFPSDDRSLAARAAEYFTNNELELQSFFDAMLWTAWNRYKDESEPEAFFRAFQNSSEGVGTDGGVSAETSS